MNKSTIVSAIKQVLVNELHTPGLDHFSEQSRLNEDLYLDSILVMQLLVFLETELGIDIPDDALNADDFKTVSSLADFLLARNTQQSGENSAEAQEPSEEFLDIKVHCFVSCLCEIIKADPRVDHRPFYFGVWDAEVVVDDNHHLNYHSATINHDFFRTWYKRLYGVAVNPWYKASLGKQENIQTLLHMLDTKSNTRQIMVMLDMYRLPERENKFNQNPFPHYVLLEKTHEPDKWFMSDPDFRWEGLQEREQVLHAIESEAVGGGYYFDSLEIQASAKQDIYEYFIACFNIANNPMTDSVLKIAHHFIPQNISARTHDHDKEIGEAIKQLPVLAIRKYAYEHGFAYFWRELGLDDAEFENWCDVIEELVSSYKKIHFRAIKLSSAPHAQQGKEAALDTNRLIAEIYQLLEQQNQREFTIKQGLLKVFNQWCEKNGFPLAEFSDKPNTVLMEVGA